MSVCVCMHVSECVYAHTHVVYSGKIMRIQFSQIGSLCHFTDVTFAGMCDYVHYALHNRAYILWV